jgi:hypothetical protein
MSRRHKPPSSVRPERTLTRCGLWATGPTQLQLPFEATGLSERIHASGRLQLSPDYDVFAWLCERWQRQPTPSGWMRPTLYEVGSALYGRPPSNADYRQLRAALDRLAWVAVTIDGYDIETGRLDDRQLSSSNLVELRRPQDDPDGLQRPSIRFAEWLRQALAEERVVRMPWRTLRSFGRNHQLAKRLWLYLAAERWKRQGAGDVEATWIRCGDQLEAALGMDYDRPRAARAALKRACVTIRRTDARYAAGALDVVQVARHNWRIAAERPTWEAWRELRAEHAAVREQIARSLGTSARPSGPGVPERPSGAA